MMILNLAGKLKRKPSGGERAWFLEEESEPRNKLVLIDLDDKSIAGDPRGYVPLVAERSPRRGGSESGSRALEGGSQFPLQGLAGENQRADVSASLTVSFTRFWRCFHSHTPGNRPD